MSTIENLIGTDLHNLNDIDLHATKEQIAIELKRRSDLRIEQTFQSLSHLSLQELVKLNQRITDHLEQPALVTPPSVNSAEPANSIEPVASAEEGDDSAQQIEEVAQPVNPSVLQLVEESVQPINPSVLSDLADSEPVYTVEEVAQEHTPDLTLLEAAPEPEPVYSVEEVIQEQVPVPAPIELGLNRVFLQADAS